MLGPYRYHCPQHGTSDEYTLKSGAAAFAAEHRDDFHGGMHPPGECFISPELGLSNVDGRSVIVALAVVALLVFGSYLL